MKIIYVSCKACKGTGEFLGRECKTCRGQGQIAVKIKDEKEEESKCSNGLKAELNY